MSNIALIGFMGAGKSTVASLLAKQLNAKLVETDMEVLKLSGQESINAIFDVQGEAHFRELEKQALIKAVKEGNCVISCGGGMVTDKENIELLKKNAVIVFLHASFAAIKLRLKSTDTRPLFRQEERALLLYAQRMPLYQQCANIKIDTDNLKPEEIVKLIMDKYKTANAN